MDRGGLGPGDWALLRSAPWVVAVGVMMSDPSGPLGRRNELATVVVEARRAVTEDGSELVRAVAAEVAEDAVEHGVEAAGLEVEDGVDVPGRAVERTAEVSRVLEAVVAPTAPDDAVAFRAWLGTVAVAVAQATREGALGIGGAAVSADERRFLAELDRALDVPAAPDRR
jgi:hypothetical protein